MKRRGFTYVELMTVWAIILILAAILFPVFARARAKAQQNNCLRNLQSIGVALRVYAQDYYGHFPAQNNNLWPLVPKALPDPRVLLCPSAQRPIGSVPAGTIAAAVAYGESDYVYWGGACDDDRPDFAIVSDDDATRHNQGASYLWVDGHVKWMSDYYLRESGGPSALSGSALLGGYQQLEQLRRLKPNYVPGQSPSPTAGRPLEGRL